MNDVNRRFATTVVALSLWLTPTALAAAPDVEAAAKVIARGEDNDVSQAPPTISHRAGVFHGRRITYTATAGRIPVLAPDGSVDAQIFFVAYTVDGGSPARPITFLSNGGPGAATAWLHLGGVGPRKVQLNADGSVPPSPIRLSDNPDCPLDRTDLVFIDAPGTGFSRVAGEESKKRLFTRTGDLEAYADFIQNYIREHGRFGAPLYLWGESYGSFRMAGLSDVLVRHGVPLKGIILLSSVLDFHVTDPGMTNDLPYVLALPSFASIAAYHHLLDPALVDGEPLRHEVQTWALNVYSPALAKGNLLGGAELAAVVAGLVRYTGLSPAVVQENNVRIGIPEFMKYLNASRGVITGRTDGRLLGAGPASQVEEPYYDPAMGALTPAFTSAASQYLFDELKYKTKLPYRMYSRDVASRYILSEPQIYGDLGYPQVLTALQSTAVKNRDFRILAMQGVYDLATPFWSMEYSLDHMPLPAEYLPNITKVRLTGGHMAYDDRQGIREMNDAVARFIDGGTSPVAATGSRRR